MFGFGKVNVQRLINHVKAYHVNMVCLPRQDGMFIITENNGLTVYALGKTEISAWQAASSKVMLELGGINNNMNNNW